MRRIFLAIFTLLVLLPVGAWGALALWYKLPFEPSVRGIGAAVWVGAIVIAIWLIWTRRFFVGVALTAVLLACLLAWWSTILPSQDRDWQPDMAHLAIARIDGDTLTVENVRNFRWHDISKTEERWETRQYRVSQLQGVDLFLSHWSGELVAHAIISFNFADTLPLAFSIEIRREDGEAFSSIAGFFKMYELGLVAADERDVVKVRSTVRGEDVRLYRLAMQPETALGLLREYVALSQDLSANPRWYHTLTANCTTVIFGMARRLDPGISLDWRVLLPGKLPSYLQENAFLRQDVGVDELIRKGQIGTRSAGAYPDDGFSARIREGVPTP